MVSTPTACINATTEEAHPQSARDNPATAGGSQHEQESLPWAKGISVASEVQKETFETCF